MKEKDEKHATIEELVYDTCSTMGETIIDEGLERQIKFLEANGVDCGRFKPPPPRVNRETTGPWFYRNGQVEVRKNDKWGVICKMDRSTEASQVGIGPVNRDANAKLIARLPDILSIAHYMEGLLLSIPEKEREWLEAEGVDFRKIRQTLRDTPGDKL